MGWAGADREGREGGRGHCSLGSPKKVIGLGNRAESAREGDDRTLCPCLEQPTHPSGPVDRVQSRCRCVVPLGLESGPGPGYRGQQNLEQGSG